MNNLIKSITEKVPKETSLPDGYYYGTWGGYIIEVQYNGKQYELTTQEGVWGIGIKVIVEVKGDIVTFDTVKL